MNYDNMFSLRFFLIYLSIVLVTNVNAGSIIVEQTAFNYFLNNLDSIRIFYGDTVRQFDKEHSKLHFDGTAKCCASIDIRLNNGLEKPFLELDTSDLTRNPQWYYTDSINTSLKWHEAYIVKSSLDNFRKHAKRSDIYISVSSKLSLHDFYYVRISIWLFNEEHLLNDVYIKLDQNGIPQGFIQRFAIS